MKPCDEKRRAEIPNVGLWLLLKLRPA